MSSSCMTRLDFLPARPPTPPRDVSKDVNDAIALLNDSNEAGRDLLTFRDSETCKDTPKRAPSGPASASATAKRVGFSSLPTFVPADQTRLADTPVSLQQRRSLAANDGSALKSILKSSHLPPPLTPDDLERTLRCPSPAAPESLTTMLQSIIHHLAGQCQKARLDAYLMLNGALKAYDAVPDRALMRENMALLTQFMTRDITWKNPDGRLDTRIASQALRLACSVLFDTRLAEAMDDDFRTFLVDRSITVMDNGDVPKQIIKTHAYLLMQKRLSKQIINSVRAERLVTTLKTIEDRCTGNSIIASRLVIYQRLLEQAPGVMLTRLRDWLEHVFHCMSGSIKDIKIRAIETCAQAGLALGTHSFAARTLLEMFETEVEDGQTYFDFFTDRLNQAIGDKESAVFVPQILAAFLLFLRHKRQSVVQWSRFHTWLAIVQRCFNSSDFTVKKEAHLAWIKLFFTVMPDSTTPKPLLALFRVPMANEFTKKGDKITSRTFEFALGTYRALLYYSLRPGLSYEDLDLAWDMYVEPLLTDLAKETTRGRHAACGVLHGLFSSGQDVWNERSAIALEPIRSHQLPRLEVRWVRSRFAKIVNLMETVMMTAVRLPNDDEIPTNCLWESLVQALGDAGSQEVRTSVELKEAIAEIMNLFRRMWTSAVVSPDTAAATFVQRMGYFICTAIERLGPAHFTEVILTLKENNDVGAAPTPSNRSTKHQRTLECPLAFLSRLFFNPPRFVVANRAYFNAFGEILRSCLGSKAMPSTLQILNGLLISMNIDQLDPSKLSLASHLWDEISTYVGAALPLSIHQSTITSSQQSDQQLSDAVMILCVGLRIKSCNKSDMKGVLTLYSAVSTLAESNAGDGGVALALMEPLAKCINDLDDDVGVQSRLQLSSMLLERTVWPRKPPVLQASRPTLWGPGTQHKKSAVLEPFDHVYALVENTLAQTYVGLLPELVEDGSRFLSNLMSFCQSSPPTLLATTIDKIQAGIVLWVEDRKGAIFTQNEEQKLLAVGLTEFWLALLQLLRTIPSIDGDLLFLLEPLLIAGFSSPRRAIVNASIDFWNNAFGDEENLAYPDGLAGVLKSLQDHVELALPNFPEEVSPAVLPAFVESQAPEDDHGNLSRPHPLMTEPDLSISHGPLAAVAHSPARSPGTASGQIQSVEGGESLKAAPNAKLRHDDSQVDSVPIQSPVAVQRQDSELLTEHQQEVRARQKENAQMFPDLSSSPAGKHVAWENSLRNPDFNSNPARDAERQSTPPLPEGNDSSEYYGSSPTPVVTKLPASERDDRLDANVDDVSASEPQSSPPRQGQEVEDAAADPAAASKELEQPSTEEPIIPGANPGEAGLDVQLANAQLQEEEELAARAQERLSRERTPPHPSDNAQVDGSDFTTSSAGGSQSLHFSGSPDAQGTQERATAESPSVSDEAVSRVQESLVAVDTQQSGSILGTDLEEATETSSMTQSQESQRSGRKRKRTTEVDRRTKKQKRESPLKKILGWFSGSQQTDDDDEIEEVIVVASRRALESPASNAGQPWAAAESQPRGVAATGTTDESPQQDQIEADKQAGPLPKRGRGRPPSVAKTVPSPPHVTPQRRLKRKASSLRSAGSQPGRRPRTRLQEAAASGKKSKDSDGASAADSSQSSEGLPLSGRRLRKPAPVAPPPPLMGENATEKPTEDGPPSSPAVSQASNGTVHGLASATRIATPRSIFARLRAVLGDMRNVALGSQETREMDDVLYELRREAFDAGRRGAEQR